MPSTTHRSPLEVTRRESPRTPPDEHELTRLATVVEQASDAIVITDPQGTIQYVNPAFERITGYRRDEVVGQNPRILKSTENEPAVHENLWDTISRGEVWKGHLTNQRKDGTLYQVEATISPVYDRDGGIVNYAAVTRDVTQEIELEARLRQAEKMEAVGQLASGVAHDFNNVLTAILSSVGLLRAALAKEPASHDAIMKAAVQIERSARRGASLTRQLLTFSRRQTVKLEPLHPNRVVVDSERMLRRLIARNITVEMQLAPDASAINGNASQLEQILMNLVVNARDAMPSGGRLTITTANVVLDEAYVSGHHDASTGPHVMLSVRDTGGGMTPEVLQHIYEPFFTTKPPGQGTGLGLATVYANVRRCGGHIIATSAPNEGTEFKIYFPAVPGRVDEAPAAEGADTFLHGDETVLVCEDDEVIRELLCEILEGSGYRVLSAEHGKRALALARDSAAHIDLLITDVMMPEMDGRVLAEKLRSLHSNLKVLFVSGYAEEVIAPDGEPRRDAQFLPKPFTSSGFLRRIREVLDRQETPVQPIAES